MSHGRRKDTRSGSRSYVKKELGLLRLAQSMFRVVRIRTFQKNKPSTMLSHSKRIARNGSMPWKEYVELWHNAVTNVVKRIPPDTAIH